MCHTTWHRTRPCRWSSTPQGTTTGNPITGQERSAFGGVSSEAPAEGLKVQADPPLGFGALSAGVAPRVGKHSGVERINVETEKQQKTETASGGDPLGHQALSLRCPRAQASVLCSPSPWRPGVLPGGANHKERGRRFLVPVGDIGRPTAGLCFFQR